MKTGNKMNKPDGNLFDFKLDTDAKFESFDELFTRDSILIERIISTGQSTPDGKWLEQDRDEWVILFKGSAKLSFKDGKVLELDKGDYVFIPANTKHRVDSTSRDPYCLWLAVHGYFNSKE